MTKYYLLLDMNANSPENPKVVFRWPNTNNNNDKANQHNSWPTVIEVDLKDVPEDDPFERDNILRPLRLFHQLYVLCNPEGAPDLRIFQQNKEQWVIIKQMKQMWNDQNLNLGCTIKGWNDAYLWHNKLNTENAEIHRIRRALEFYDAASYIGNLYAQIVMLVSGMEVLFTLKMGNTGKRLARRLVGMLYNTEKEKRESTMEDINKLYGFRSQIVHSGSFPFDKNGTISYRSNCVKYLQKCIIHLLSSDNDYKQFSYENHKNFMQCLERRCNNINLE